MKLLVNTTALAPPLAGIGHYSAQLLQQLLNATELTDIKGISLSGAQLKSRSQLEQMLESVAQPAEVAVASPLQRLARNVPLARSLRRMLVKHSMKMRTEQLQGYIYWEPNCLRLPLEKPSAVTVYDLSHIAHPEFHPEQRVRTLDKALPASLENASKIITISEFSRQEILAEFAVPADKITLVPPAVSERFRYEPTVAQLQAVKQRYQLPERYILSVGTLEPRKNILRLLEAFSALTPEVRRAYPLVMVGARGWCLEGHDKVIGRLESRGELIRTGYIPQADIPLLYRNATLLAYISLYEGYGMPIAEAMAAGVPVLCSNTTSMPDVAAGAAVLVNPYDIEAIKAGLLRLINDEKLRQHCCQAGLRESADYTWINSGEKLISTLNSIVG